MKKNNLLSKIILSFLLLFITFFYSFNLTYAENNWSIIPTKTGDVSEQVNQVGEEPGKVWEKYDEISKQEPENAGNAFASGIFSWDTIFYFLKHIANLLSEIGLVIGAFMIIYAGYKYAIGIFSGDASKGGQDVIKGAIYGVLIIIFSYAIMKILLAMFL